MISGVLHFAVSIRLVVIPHHAVPVAAPATVYNTGQPGTRIPRY